MIFTISKPNKSGFGFQCFNKRKHQKIISGLVLIHWAEKCLNSCEVVDEGGSFQRIFTAFTKEGTELKYHIT